VASGLGPFFYQDAHQTLRFQESDLNVVNTEIGSGGHSFNAKTNFTMAV
jgi:hypothetical protein